MGVQAGVETCARSLALRQASDQTVEFWSYRNACHLPVGTGSAVNVPHWAPVLSSDGPWHQGHPQFR